MNYIKKIRENLKDPKKKSLTMLGLYLIFFIFVFLVIVPKEPSSSTNYTDYIENENKVISYGYIYKINDNGNIIEINGTLNSNENTYNYSGNNYIKKDGVVYLNGEITEEIFNTEKYSYSNIENIIENSEFIEKTIYQDNSEKVIYNLTMDKYFSFVSDTNTCDIKDCTLIKCSIVVESNENINRVSIDLSNYYGYNYIVEISYLNIIR